MMRRYAMLPERQRAAAAREEAFFTMRDGPVRSEVLAALRGHQTTHNTAQGWLTLRGLSPTGRPLEGTR